VKALAVQVLAHRLALSPEAELDGVPPRKIVEESLETVLFHRRESRH